VDSDVDAAVALRLATWGAETKQLRLKWSRTPAALSRAEVLHRGHVQLENWRRGGREAGPRERVG
jgi:hypothetical protein